MKKKREGEKHDGLIPKSGLEPEKMPKTLWQPKTFIGKFILGDDLAQGFGTRRKIPEKEKTLAWAARPGRSALAVLAAVLALKPESLAAIASLAPPLRCRRLHLIGKHRLQLVAATTTRHGQPLEQGGGGGKKRVAIDRSLKKKGWRKKKDG